jgi:rare lipoprotein A
MLRIIVLLGAIALWPSFALAKDRCGNEIQRGEASWYGPGFEGDKTKNGEVFNPYALSAAHPDLPFGTKVKVTNLRNYRSVVVKINDRGGFGGRRAIDLSEAAAQEIGMIDQGTAAVAVFRCQ